MAAKRKNAEDRLNEGLARMAAKYGKNWQRGMLTKEEDAMMLKLFEDNKRRIDRAVKRDRAKASRKPFYAYTPQQVKGIKSKLSAAIREITKVLDNKELKSPYASNLKTLRKKLMDANNYIGWTVEPIAQDKPKGKYL